MVITIKLDNVQRIKFYAHMMNSLETKPAHTNYWLLEFKN